MSNSFKRFFKVPNKIKEYFAPTYTVKLYMKSGNVVVLDKVHEDVIFTSGNGVNVCRISGFKQKSNGENILMINVLDLNQIEAVVINKE